MGLTHDEFLIMICGVCTRKPKKGLYQKITPRILELIKKYQCCYYVTETMPSIVCKTCVKSLNDIEELGSDSPSNLPDIDYDKLMPNRRSLGENGVCNCGFCKIGRLNGKDYLTHHNSIDLQFTVTQLKLKNAAIIAML